MNLRRLVLLLLSATGVSSAQTSGDSIRWTFGTAAGQLKFSDGSKESALGITIAARGWGGIALLVNPTYAWAQSAPVPVQVGSVTKSQSLRFSGFTDLPVSVGISRRIEWPWSPSVGFSLGMTLPTGDTATVGSGKTGLGANLSAGFWPTDNFYFGVGAGRSLSNGYNAALGSSSTTVMGLSAWFKAGGVGLGLSLSGDVGEVPSGFEKARGLGAGVAVPLAGGVSLNLDGSTGLTKGSPAWAYAVGIGTTTAGVAAAAVGSFQRLQQAFGQGTTIKPRPRTK